MRFSEEAKAILKSELKRNRLTYAELATRLTQSSLPMTEPALRNKISRGGFSAGFFFHCLAVIGTQTIQINPASGLYEHQPNLDLEP
ncbi:MAG: DUF6471 domain-containing protein [Pseudomonadota bacterium]